ncbi:imidazole glycerol phosphate synthase subunit HisH [Spirulina subsalsa FACHB-351]|uniref:Imidazole glycerol phosphate synthase subunit HisH n=1 Tax=Spirulina subsalsa FACHB-351 TaxID=234711 RepID=A0ABT3L8R1_9CYAN|nr:imidazole glycerol phosphate synthase subunit HisH [Spirulina subsalsa]MCW6037901.1 imidazole glycerol phosphate synthase subunit HisH [Spirulina subsalsa FACHB-351]
MKQNIIVIDYGAGNLWSVLNAIRYLGSQASISGNPEEIRGAECLILPGVGSFRKAMETLQHSNLAQAILEAVQLRGCKILGICLGMQLLGSHGTEDGDTVGLGLIPNRVDKFTDRELSGNKIPHVGFNTVNFAECKGLFSNFSDEADFYFVHSYRMLPENLQARLAICHYGVEFVAAFEKNNICGTQFHPEKSQTNGLMLLDNFLKL